MTDHLEDIASQLEDRIDNYTDISYVPDGELITYVLSRIAIDLGRIIDKIEEGEA